MFCDWVCFIFPGLNFEVQEKNSDTHHPFCQTCHQHNVKYEPHVYRPRLLKSFTFAPSLVKHDGPDSLP